MVDEVEHETESQTTTEEHHTPPPPPPEHPNGGEFHCDHCTEHARELVEHTSRINELQDQVTKLTPPPGEETETDITPQHKPWYHR